MTGKQPRVISSRMTMHFEKGYQISSKHHIRPDFAEEALPHVFLNDVPKFSILSSPIRRFILIDHHEK